MTSPRWKPPVDRWTVSGDRLEAGQRFLGASLAFIAKGKPSEEWTEAERLGIRLATQLNLAFGAGDEDEWVSILRAALDLFKAEPDQRARRYFAVRTIAEWGARMKKSNATREWILDQCIRELSLHDEGFEELRKDRECLGSLLDRWDPEPAFKDGAMSAETIVATLALDDAIAVLGLEPRKDEERAEKLSRYRTALANDVNKYRKR